jgi:hypothetical protein
MPRSREEHTEWAILAVAVAVLRPYRPQCLRCSHLAGAAASWYSSWPLPKHLPDENSVSSMSKVVEVAREEEVDVLEIVVEMMPLQLLVPTPLYRAVATMMSEEKEENDDD